MPCFFYSRSQSAAASCREAFFVLALSDCALLFLFADRCRITGGVAQRLVVAVGEHVGRPEVSICVGAMADVSGILGRNGANGEGDRRK